MYGSSHESVGIDLVWSSLGLRTICVSTCLEDATKEEEEQDVAEDEASVVVYSV